MRRAIRKDRSNLQSQKKAKGHSRLVVYKHELCLRNLCLRWFHWFCTSSASSWIIQCRRAPGLLPWKQRLQICMRASTEVAPSLPNSKRSLLSIMNCNPVITVFNASVPISIGCFVFTHLSLMIRQFVLFFKLCPNSETSWRLMNPLCCLENSQKSDKNRQLRMTHERLLQAWDLREIPSHVRQNVMSFLTTCREGWIASVPCSLLFQQTSFWETCGCQVHSAIFSFMSQLKSVSVVTVKPSSPTIGFEAYNTLPEQLAFI